MEFLLKESIVSTQEGLAKDLHPTKEPSLALMRMLDTLCEKVIRDEERVRARK